MAGQSEPEYFKDARKEGKIVVTETPKFDLESYVANYKGKPRIERLYHIGKTSTVLYHESLQMAATEAKKGKDTELYERVMAIWQFLEPNNPKAQRDEGWISQTTRENKVETGRLEAELKGYKNNLIKESIRMGYDDTGRHYQELGELGEAQKSFQKEREVSQTPVHVAIMLQRLIDVNMEQRNWMNVESNVSKFRNVLHSAPSMQKYETIYTAAMGLAQMSLKNYQGATETFLSLNNDIIQPRPDSESENDPKLMTSSDIATYGALCALASLDRAQLQSRVLENSSFRQYLEIEPHLRRAVTTFISGKFATCLSILDSYRADYLLDMYLAPHFPTLFDRIRSKAIVQYFVPFSCVTFKSLAQAFNTSQEVIEASAVELIKAGSLPARLDLENGLLVANKENSRATAHEEALRVAKEYEKTAHQRILRMEIINAKLEVRDMQRQAHQNALQGDIMNSSELGSHRLGSVASQLSGVGKKFFGH